MPDSDPNTADPDNFDPHNPKPHTSDSGSGEAARFPENRSPGVLDNALERTDDAFRGRRDDRRLIGEDIPREVQEREEDEDAGLD